MTETSTTKKCPFCGEEIKAEAVVCRYCQHELTGTEKGKILSQEITRRQNQGWVLISQTGDSAQLTKPKSFNWGLFILLLIIGIFLIELPLFIYLIVFFVGKPELVTLTVNDSLGIVVNGIQPYVAPSGTPRTPAEEEAAKKSSARTGWIILGVVVLVLGIIICIASQQGNAPVPFGALQSLALLI
jgi:hypothetical protein